MTGTLLLKVSHRKRKSGRKKKRCQRKRTRTGNECIVNAACTVGPVREVGIQFNDIAQEESRKGIQTGTREKKQLCQEKAEDERTKGIAQDVAGGKKIGLIKEIKMYYLRERLFYLRANNMCMGIQQTR